MGSGPMTATYRPSTGDPSPPSTTHSEHRTNDSFLERPSSPTRLEPEQERSSLLSPTQPHPLPAQPQARSHGRKLKLPARLWVVLVGAGAVAAAGYLGWYPSWGSTSDKDKPLSAPAV